MRTTAALIAGLAFLSPGCGGPAVGPVPPGAAKASKPPEPPPIPGGQTFDNPGYKHWAKFKPGTAVTRRMTTANDVTGQKTVTTTTYTLKDRTDNRLVVEFVSSTTHWDGRSEANPPQELEEKRTYTLPPGATPAEPARAEEGEETVEALGKKYQARWYKGRSHTDAGEASTQTWTSSEVPGGLLKSVSKVAAVNSTITTELVELKVVD